MTLHHSIPMLRTFFRHPLLWLLIGPPVLRFGAARGAGETLAGNYDIWVFVQIALYMAAGTYALGLLLGGSRRGFSAFGNPGFVQLLVMFLCLVTTLFLSVLYSPSFLLTLVYCTLFLMALVALVEFSVNASSPGNRVSIISLFRILRAISTMVLLLVIVIFFIDPAQVSATTSFYGARLMGGKIGSVPLLTVTIYCISVYFFVHKIETRMTTAAYVVLALVAMAMSQTRAAYVVAMLITLHGVWVWLATSRAAESTFARLAVVAASLLIGGYFVISELEEVLSFLLRGDVSLKQMSTASGRTFIFGWVLGRAVEEPMGIGYVAGFRTEFRKLGMFEFRGLLTANIGDAHNMFLEYLIGGGWAALSFFVLITAITLASLKRVAASTRSDGRAFDLMVGRDITFVLFSSYLLMSLTSSEFGIPARMSFAYIFFTIGVAMIIRLRRWHSRRARFHEHPTRA